MTDAQKRPMTGGRWSARPDFSSCSRARPGCLGVLTTVQFRSTAGAAASSGGRAGRGRGLSAGHRGPLRRPRGAPASPAGPAGGRRPRRLRPVRPADSRPRPQAIAYHEGANAALYEAAGARARSQPFGYFLGPSPCVRAPTSSRHPRRHGSRRPHAGTRSALVGPTAASGRPRHHKRPPPGGLVERGVGALVIGDRLRGVAADQLDEPVVAPSASPSAGPPAEARRSSRRRSGHDRPADRPASPTSTPAPTRAAAPAVLRNCTVSARPRQPGRARRTRREIGSGHSIVRQSSSSSARRTSARPYKRCLPPQAAGDHCGQLAESIA